MRQKLEEVLADLHEQLESIDDLDDEQVKMLQAAAQDIRATLDQSDVSSESLAQRLNDATSQFENSHPMLTNTIGRIADLLSQMGI